MKLLLASFAILLSVFAPRKARAQEVISWDLEYMDMVINFDTSSTDELTFEYLISAGRNYNILPIRQQDCETSITDLNITLTNDVVTPLNATHSTLKISYDIDKTTIANSTVWDSETNNLKICQKVQLVSDDSPALVMMEDTFVFLINFGFEIDFNVGAGDEGRGGPAYDNTTASINEYVKACKCNGGAPYDCNSIVLLPNEELYVCIFSVSGEVRVKSVDSMNVGQDGSQALTVVESGDVKYSSFSSMVAVPENYGYKVDVRLPINLFNFSGPDITVSGVIEMEFGEGRKLRMLNTGAITETVEAAPFVLKIPLRESFELEEPYDANAKSVKVSPYPSYVLPMLAVAGTVSMFGVAGMGRVLHNQKGRMSAEFWSTNEIN